jgi:hypothetical protein
VKTPVRSVQSLALRGLDLAPPQVWGGIRLVPLLRREVRDDLRLAMRRYAERLAVVSLDGELLAPGIKYVSFVPHGLVVSWTDDGTPVASFGAALAAGGKAGDGRALGRSARVLHRMARRESDRALRILPLHLAMEGFLALHFGGPEIAWTEYSRRALQRGLAPRAEWSAPGTALPGFQDALRVFEIHERQAGVLVFVADALASAFVVPHPDDYRALHRSLLEDFYGELLVRYGLLYPESTAAWTGIDPDRVESVADLRAGVDRMRRDWADFGALLAAGVLDREAHVADVYRLGPFRLQRFLTSLLLHEENHIGERIERDDGTTEYLKTYRLSDAQARRAHLLEQLAASGWDLDRTAEALRTTKDELVRRVDGAGFGYLLKPEVLEATRRGRR